MCRDAIAFRKKKRVRIDGADCLPKQLCLSSFLAFLESSYSLSKIPRRLWGCGHDAAGEGRHLADDEERNLRSASLPKIYEPFGLFSMLRIAQGDMTGDPGLWFLSIRGLLGMAVIDLVLAVQTKPMLRS